MLEALNKDFAGRASIVYVNLEQQGLLASRYHVRSNPTLVFYDRAGKEVRRHRGMLPQAAIATALRGMGVK